jgi:hypothetical protein
VRVVKALPPNYGEICAALGVPPDTVCYAWGDIIYSPSSTTVPPEIEVHEEVHSRQQEEIGGPEIWWAKYLHDVPFRLQQEVEAYRAQIASLPTRPERRNCRRRVAIDLATLYGLPITRQQADDFIQGHSMTMATKIKAR